MCQEVISIYGTYKPHINIHYYILLQNFCIKTSFPHQFSESKICNSTQVLALQLQKIFTVKFRRAGTLLELTSKMLGDNRTHPVTTTDPFASLSQFPHPSKMHPTTDNDDRSSISTSDNDDSCSVQLSNEKLLLKGGQLPPGKKTRGRVKIEMQYIQNKLRRYTTFSKRKSGIMKKVSK